MRVIGTPKLHKFWKRQRDAKAQLEAWYAETEHAIWTNPHDVKQQYGKASIIGNNRVVFNICGGSYRLIVHIKYGFETVVIRFIGTHAEYDRVNVEEI